MCDAGQRGGRLMVSMTQSDSGPLTIRGMLTNIFRRCRTLWMFGTKAIASLIYVPSQGMAKPCFLPITTRGVLGRL